MSWFSFWGIALVSIGSIMGVFGGQSLTSKSKIRNRRIKGTILVVAGSIAVLLGGNLIGGESNRVAKEKIEPYINDKIFQICYNCYEIRLRLYVYSIDAYELKNNKNKAFKNKEQLEKEEANRRKYPNDEELERMLTLIDRNIYSYKSKVMQQVIYEDWITFFAQRVDRTNEAIEDIYSQSAFVDNDLLEDINRIEKCRFWNWIEYENALKEKKLDYATNLSPFSCQEQFSEYFKLLKEFQTKHYKTEVKFPRMFGSNQLFY